MDMLRCRLGLLVRLLLMCFAVSPFGFAADSLAPIVANQNHVPAGALRDGVLSIRLEIAKGEWHPEAGLRRKAGEVSQLIRAQQGVRNRMGKGTGSLHDSSPAS